MALTASQVELLYVAFYNRPADPAGLAYWESSSATYGQAANYFGASPEYTAMFTGLTNTQVVAQVYENMFNRLPDPAGLIYWSNLLTAGILTLGSIALTIAVGAQGTDATILANKVTAATDFTNNIVTTPEILAYSGAAANHQASLWLDTVGSSPSSLTGALGTEAGVIAALIAPVIGTTSTLTTGIDTFAGAAGNAIFNSLNTTAGGATLNALDSLTGTGTNNAFNISDNSSTSIFAGNLANSVSVSGIQTVNINELNAVGNSAQNDFSGWTGLTALNINASTGTDSVKAAATTNVKVVDSAGAVTVAGGNADTITTTSGNVVVTTPISATVTTTAGSVSVTGATGAVTATDTAVATTGSASSATDAIYVAAGSNVTVTATGLTQTSTYTSGTVTIGSSTSAITGTVSVTTGESLADRTAQGAITVNGGTTVTVTENANNAVNTTATLGAVTINGGANTTSATVTQATAATAASAVVGVGNGTDKVVDAQYAASTTAGKNGLGTITSVAFTGLGGTSNEIDDSNLQSLTVNNSPASTTVAVKEGALTSGITAATTLTLSLSNNAGLTVSDQNKYTALNVVTGTTGSTLTVVGTTNNSVITTENISGSSVLTQTAATSSTGMLALTAINVTGAAGLTDSDLAPISTLTTLNAANTSGAITVAISDAKTAFTGGSGRDIVTITADTTTPQIIAAGSASNNEIILSGANSAFNHAGAAKLTGFTIAGFDANAATSSGTYDLSSSGSGLVNGISTVEIITDISGSSAATVAYKINTGTSVQIDASLTYETASFTSYDMTGALDINTVTIGAATNSTDITVKKLSFTDMLSASIGNLNIVSNDTGGTTGINTITTLTDNATSLTFSGAGGLTIGNSTSSATANALVDAATTLSIVNAGSGGVVVNAISDGSTYGVGTAATLTLTNSGTGTLTVGAGTNGTAIADATLATLNLNGAVTTTIGGTGASSTGVTTGITVTGTTDNSIVKLYFTGASVGNTDNITLGNGADTVYLKTGGGTENVTLGTGANSVTLSPAGVNNLTFAAHSSTTVDTVIDTSLTASANNTATGSVASVITANMNVITGLQKGDLISFAAATAQTGTSLTGISAAATVAAATNLAGVNAQVEIAKGTYASGTFTYNSTGNDSLLTFDSGLTTGAGTQTHTFTSIVLVGFHDGVIASSTYNALSSSVLALS